MGVDRVCHSRTKVWELVNILGVGEDRGGEALRLYAARLRGAVEHRFDLLVLEQAGVHCVGDRKTMFFEGGGGGFDDFHRLRRSSTHSCLLCWWVMWIRPPGVRGRPRERRAGVAGRPEERREGKEGVRPGRMRWLPEH